MRAGKDPRRLTVVVALLVTGGILLSLYVSAAWFWRPTQSSSSKSSALVPMLWESTAFKMSNGQTAAQVASEFKANFIFRGTFQWGLTGVVPGPESSTPFFIKISESIKALKHSNPGLLYEGGFGTQYLPRTNAWPNGTAVSYADINSMAGRSSSGGLLELDGFHGYIPDLASPTFRTYVTLWSERQIDAGVDGMFFDDPYLYATYLVNVEHQNASAVYDLYAGYMGSIVQSLRSYASAHGGTFFATINSGRCTDIQRQLRYPAGLSFVSYFSCSADDRDFNVAANPSLQPVENFTQIKASVEAVVDVPIMVFIDWPAQQFALANMTTQQQILVLTNLGNALRASGVPFVYHLYHHTPPYDSVAEGTYSTLLQLAKQGGTGPTVQAALPLLAIPVLITAAMAVWLSDNRILKQNRFV